MTSKRWLLRLICALVVTVGALIWVLRDVEADQVVSHLAVLPVSTVLTYFVAQLVVQCLRILRWAIIVRPLGARSIRSIVAAANVGTAASFFLPLRLGEFARPALLARGGVPFASGVASVVVERLTDAIGNLLIFFVLLSSVPASSAIAPHLRIASAIVLVVFAAAICLLVLAARFRHRLSKMLNEKVRGSSYRSRLIRAAHPVAERFIDGVATLGNPRRGALFILLTAAYWTINALAVHRVAEAYHPGLSVSGALFAVSVTVFLVMLPAGPAFAGTMEAGYRLGLTPFGLTPTAALAVGLALHIMQIIVFSTWWLVGMGLYTFSKRRGKERGSREQANPAFHTQPPNFIHKS